MTQDSKPFLMVSKDDIRAQAFVIGQVLTEAQINEIFEHFSDYGVSTELTFWENLTAIIHKYLETHKA